MTTYYPTNASSLEASRTSLAAGASPSSSGALMEGLLGGEVASLRERLLL